MATRHIKVRNIDICNSVITVCDASIRDILHPWDRMQEDFICGVCSDYPNATDAHAPIREPIASQAVSATKLAEID